MKIEGEYLENLLGSISDSDYCYLCDNHPSTGHGEGCPLNDAFLVCKFDPECRFKPTNNCKFTSCNFYLENKP